MQLSKEEKLVAAMKKLSSGSGDAWYSEGAVQKHSFIFFEARSFMLLAATKGEVETATAQEQMEE